MEESVARAEDPGHECLCVVVKIRRDPEEIHTYLDRFRQHVPSSDQPFCDDCEDRHPETEDDLGVVEVTNICQLEKAIEI